MKSEPEWLNEIIAPQITNIPPYVPGKPIAELTREMGITNAIKMASNENPLGPSPKAMEAIRKQLDQIHIYPESSAPDLRQAISAKYAVPIESLILGVGSDEIMSFAAHVFLRPGCEAIMSEHAFSMYKICVNAFGATPVTAPLKNYGNDLQGMLDKVTDKTRLVFLAIPNSPTGAINSKGEFEWFLEELIGRKLVVIIDEAYGEYIMDSDCPSGVDYLNHETPVLVLKTCSKIYGLAGLRVGYGFGPTWMIDLLNRVRAPFNVNFLGQVGAVAALSDIAHVRSSRELNKRGLGYLSKRLSDLGYKVIPSQANFVTFKTSNQAKVIYDGLLRRGIIVRHLASFGMPEYIRVTVGLDEHNERFINELSALKL